jgi:hypothetical protein
VVVVGSLESARDGGHFGANFSVWRWLWRWWWLWQWRRVAVVKNMEKGDGVGKGDARAVGGSGRVAVLGRVGKRVKRRSFWC